MQIDLVRIRVIWNASPPASGYIEILAKHIITLEFSFKERKEGRNKKNRDGCKAFAKLKKLFETTATQAF